METNYIFFIILLVLIIFIIFRFVLADYNNMKLTNPVIVPNTIEISKRTPNVRIYRSQDKMGGLEFTYTFWLWINGNSLNEGQKNNVFLKGANAPNCNDINIQSPGVWIEKSSNQAKMIIYTNLYLPDNCSDFDGDIIKCPKYCSWNKENNKCESKNEISNLAGMEVDNIPIDNWVHFTLSVVNRRMDVYVNGELYSQKRFDALPQQNDNKIIIGACNNLSGKLSDLRYFNHSLSSYEIEKILNRNIPPLDTSASLGRDNNNYLSKYYWIDDTYK